MRAVVVVLAGLCLPVAGQAQTAEMPNYDVERQCRRIAAIGGNYSEAMYGACFDSEQSSYDNVKLRWSALPESIRRQCDRIARVGGPGSYSMLEACVQSEESAGRQNQQRQFRR
ncbi:hypothetical protein KPL78_19120 [Roseomonas sp. HJA6]|uniref:UrcA family protein n=1 Tax=Roseomonas alba TaxID=2846776 RepID=A0ABS7AFB1_9PROT|nr:hypothetical protein [Neoroseomonas alba]MBW6399980.1 hypothetical protein [Neoroseomonas alba]